MRRKLITILFTGCAMIACAQERIGTPEQRDALFDTLVNRTLRWESWSPFKANKQGDDYQLQAEALRDEVVNATTELELVIALQKLSNLRQDRHLRFDEDFPRVVETRVEAPIQFSPDFSTTDVHVFVSDTAVSFSTFSDEQVILGNELIRVNGIELADYFDRLQPFLRYSTLRQMRWEFAKFLSLKWSTFDPTLYQADDQVRYTFKRADGTIYTITLPYTTFTLTGNGRRSFNGYERLMTSIDADMYVKYFEENIIVLLHWKDFEEVSNTVSKIINVAKANNLLDANVILDIAESSGGSRSPELIRILAQQPFQTTLGNVRIGDYLDNFTLRFSGRVREWLETDVAEARQNGEAFSNNEPFKLQFFDKGQDGIMDPAEDRFRGKLALITGSNTGSQVDQCAAMLIDNDIATVSFGMPCGGYSNTWEYEQSINFPEGSDNFFEYQWNIGHTIRPNGEVLEANPALPKYPVLLTAENFKVYYDDMIKIAEDSLLAYGPISVTCNLEKPDITLESGRLTTTFNAAYTYQWYKDDVLLANETNRILTETPSEGTYRVEITQGLCTELSDAFVVSVLGIDSNISLPAYSIYPQPARNGEVNICSEDLQFLEVDIFSVSGKHLKNIGVGLKTGDCQKVDLRGLSKGIYLMRLRDLYHKYTPIRLLVE